MGRRWAAAVGVVVLAALVGGCSATAPAPASAPASTAPSVPPSVPPSPSPVATPTPTGTPQEQAVAWTEAVCGALVPVVVRLTDAPGIDLNAPEATRQAWLGYLDGGLAATDEARAAVAAAGPAPVANGDVVADQVRGDLADLRADVAGARTQLERADPGSATGVGRALVGGSRLLGALLNGARVAGTLNRDPVLRDAYARSPSCARLQRSGATPPTR